MLDFYRSSVARPEIDEYLRRAHEERAAAIYRPYGTLEKGVGAVLGVIASLPETLKRWHTKRITIRELSALDDRLLADIGLSRHEITGVAAALCGASSITIPEFRAQSDPSHAAHQTPAKPSGREPVNENTAQVRKLPRAA